MIALADDRATQQVNQYFCRFLRNCQSRTLRPLEQFAEEEIILPMDGGPYQGQPFRLARQPYVALLWYEMQYGPWINFLIGGPTQSGKTLCSFVIPTIYEVVEVQRNIALGIPDEKMINDKWKVDFEKVFRASHKLERILPTRGPGSKNGSIKEYVELTNGVFMKFFTRGGSDQSKAGFTTSVAKLTEAAGWSKGSEQSKETNPFGQIAGRLRSISKFTEDGELNKERSITIEGTFTDEYDLPYSGKKGSSESQIVSQCPHCKNYVAPEREHFKGWATAKSELQAAKQGQFHCPHCKHVITDDDRHLMNQVHFGRPPKDAKSAGSVLLHKGQTIDESGEIDGPMPETSTLYFRWSAFHNEFLKSSDIAAEEWLAAQHEPETREREDAEKELCQQVWAMPYTPQPIDNAPLDRVQIRKRREQLTPGLVPANTDKFVFGVDPGRWRVWYFGLCGRSDGTLHTPVYGAVDTSITRGKEHIDEQFEKNAIKNALRELFDLIDTGWPMLGSSAARSSDLTFADSGYFPDAVFEVVREYDKKRYLPILGRGKSQMESRRYDQPSKPNTIVRRIGHGWHLEFDRGRRGYRVVLNADDAKLSIQSCLRVALGKPGSLTLPMAPEKDHITVARHLASEVFKRWIEPGVGIKEEWKKTGANHLLDCAAYAFMALRYLGWSVPDIKKQAGEMLADQPSPPSGNWLEQRLNELG